MKATDLLNLFTLAALWGLSFLFIRVAAPEFGPVALIEVRVATATVVLLPLLLLKGGLADLRQNWQPILLLGVLHYAIPFCLFAYAMLTLTGGYSAIVNASSPLFAGAVAWIVLGERLPFLRVLGLAAGIAGVFILVHDELTLKLSTSGSAIAAALAASFCYGLAAVLVRKQLADVSPTAISAGSMLAASIALAPFAAVCWPDTTPSATAWVAALMLGVPSTALAFVLYFQLIRSAGPTRAITVTFLTPVFAVLFGVLILDEPVSAPMMIGGLVILLGTAAATGGFSWSGKRQATVTRWSRQS